MIKFRLIDENDEDNDNYSFQINFESVDDFLEWTYDDSDFEAFMDKMECDNADYAGVHDGGSGGETYNTEWTYSSYEIQNFPLAISMWKEFFKSQNLLIED